MKSIILFDLDGTLVESSKKINTQMRMAIVGLYIKKYTLGIVGGGKFEKIISQLDNAKAYFKYIFSECGSVLHMYDIITDNYTLIYEKNILFKLSNDNICKLIATFNTFLRENTIYNLNKTQYEHNSNYNLSELGFHSDFTDIRNGLIYFSPIGLNSSDYYRNKFITYEKQHNFRLALINKFKELKLDDYSIVIGGNVGIALYPKEWNKSQVVNELTDYDNIYFFGDKTTETGNDYPLYIHEKVKGYAVNSPTDTLNIINNKII
jgi:phosphomannomutase